MSSGSKLGQRGVKELAYGLWWGKPQPIVALLNAMLAVTNMLPMGLGHS